MIDLPLTNALVESLLYEDEGATLDFKQTSYLFEGAERHQKAELLKDILAFANAFRECQKVCVRARKGSKRAGSRTSSSFKSSGQSGSIRVHASARRADTA